MLRLSDRVGPTCFAETVACAKATKLVTVKVTERYELKEDFNDDPWSLVRKYGVAVIRASKRVSDK